VTKLTLVVDGRPDVDLDLSGKNFMTMLRIVVFFVNIPEFVAGVRES